MMSSGFLTCSGVFNALTATLAFFFKAPVDNPVFTYIHLISGGRDLEKDEHENVSIFLTLKGVGVCERESVHERECVCVDGKVLAPTLGFRYVRF